MAGVVNLGFGIGHQHFEIAAVLKFSPNPFRIFLQLAGVVGFRENVFQEDGVRYSYRLQVLHCSAQNSGADMVITNKSNLAHADLGAFLHHKRNAHLGGRNGPHLGTHRGKLPAVFREQFLDRNLGFFDFGGIVLAFRR